VKLDGRSNLAALQVRACINNVDGGGRVAQWQQQQDSGKPAAILPKQKEEHSKQSSIINQPSCISLLSHQVC
jgi:hypothetical protein